jgi:hypothetical protein
MVMVESGTKIMGSSATPKLAAQQKEKQKQSEKE